MSLLEQSELPPDYPPFRAFRERLGFVPSVFPAQSLLPRVIEAQAALIRALLLESGALTWERREEILVAVSAALRSRYCATVHAHVLRTLERPAGEVESLAAGRFDGFDAARAGLLEFSVRLAVAPHAIGPPDFEGLRSLSVPDGEILEAIQATALARLLCTLSTGLAAEPDLEPPPALLAALAENAALAGADVPPRPRQPGAYLSSAALAPEAFPPFAFFKSRFGFVPALFRAQTLRPEALEAEAQAVRDILLTEDVLTRPQKECIRLVVAAADLSAYGVALQMELLRGLGVSPEASDRIVAERGHAGLPEADAALLDFAEKLATRPQDYGEADVRLLRERGFGDARILEAIVTTAFSTFLDTLEAGLNPRPDFKPRRDLLADRAAAAARDGARLEDPDAPLVARAKAGDVAAFEDLVRANQARVYRTLVGLTGNAEDAEDCCQAAFVKAFRGISGFAGASRFATWLTRIAINEGLERLRRTHPEVSLDEAPAGEDEFRPSRVAAWVEDPEGLYAREETRRLVRQELARLPVRYRTAVILRDIEQLSTAEAAAALDLPVATLKTRLLRGRLLMREALSAHFSAEPPGRRDG